MRCARCKGFAALVREHNSCQLKVIRCFICGYRIYPPQYVPADDDYEGCVNLLAELGDIKHWQWVEKRLKEDPDL